MASLPTPNQPRTLPDLKLTRAVEADPLRFEAIQALLNKDRRPLWERSDFLVSHIPLLPTLEACLSSLLLRKHLERGLEHIDKVLESEQLGLIALQKKQGTEPSFRVSRVMLISNDGSERFYRDCEKTLQRYSDRLLLLQVDEPSSRLALNLTGNTEKVLKALLVSDRDAVTALLFSLVGEPVRTPVRIKTKKT